MDNPEAESGQDIRWLSYNELAQALRIKRSSAVRVTLRRGWQRRPGNDATIRVGVPIAVLAGEPTKQSGPAVVPRRAAQDKGLAVRALAEAEKNTATALALADRALAQLAEAAAATARAEARAVTAESRADRAEARAESLRLRVDTLQAELADLRGRQEAPHGGGEAGHADAAPEVPTAPGGPATARPRRWLRARYWLSWT
jgi:hypothetical protein